MNHRTRGRLTALPVFLSLFVLSLAIFETVPKLLGAEPRTKAIVGATLIDGSGKPPLPDAVVLIEGERIAAAGPKSSTAIPPDAELISAEGKYILPGLIDGHVHYRTWAGELYLNHGVTSVFDFGNVSEWMVALRDGFAKGKIRRIPRIYASGYALNGPEPERFSPFASANRLVKRSGTYRLNFEDPEAVRKQVSTMLDQEGFDYIKVFQQMSPEVLKATTAEAQKRGKKVVGHTDNVYESVRAGLDGVVHLWGVAETTMTPGNLQAYEKGDVPCPYAKMEPEKVDQLIAFLIERGIYVNPLLAHEHEPVTDRTEQFKAETYRTLGDPRLVYVPVNARLAMLSVFDRARNYGRRLGGFPYLDALQKDELEQFRTGYRNAQGFVRKFTKAGGKVWVGTDAGGGSVLPGLTVHEEMQLLVDAGLSPMQAIQAATSVPAELIGKSGEVGTIQPGRFADLVVLDANPLEDIANTRKISMVFQNGERVEPGYHWDYSLPISNPVETDNVTNAYLPVPRLEEIAPKIATEGAPSFTIKLSGAGFTTRSVVMFQGVRLPTKFENTGSLSADVPAFLLATAGTPEFTVLNPPPGGGKSNPLGLVIRFR